MISLVNTDTGQYFKRLVEDTECHGYLFSPTPLVVDEALLDRLNTAVPALFDLLDTDRYFDHCMQNHWRLPVKSMQATDFTGCADFLLTDSGAKLIEMNINLPGKVGLMQTLGETARLYLGRPEAQWANLHANEALVATIRKALPTNQPIAILVSHLPASKKHQPHYRYFSEQLNKYGLRTQVVQANELYNTPEGCRANGQAFGAFINLVIPFVWEDNLQEFEQLTKLWKQHPTVFFPNPTGGMFGTKDLLCYLNAQRNMPGAELWSDYVLPARLLSDFETVNALLAAYKLEEMVLKPLKDYDTKGVCVQPDGATVETIFREKRDHYMVQEFTDSVRMPFELPDGETSETHSVILRMFVAEKQPIGYQAYYIHKAFNAEYYTAPVVVDN